MDTDKAGWKDAINCLLEDGFKGLKALTINVYFRGAPGEGLYVLSALQALDGVGRLRDREGMDFAINLLGEHIEWRPDNFPPNHPSWQPTPTTVNLN
ncbi:hypothetical protein CPB83DRAFT_908799 [Crepidotus variabilis]|uniref:Uncharacterized protein n=1 Tax=Crepidotus variabilis TaxID=179855 RepID=A0A9P6EBF5_9AGAR|nr:hypothetical protein CPB83DRAFT_908799 [Crepidotus variabilis]